MKPPAFQFYADDFLAGTVTMNFTQRGMYITLLCIQWNKGYVTADDIADLIGDGTAIAQPSANRVLAKFKLLPDGNYQNERMEQERKKQDIFRENRRAAGIKGNEIRWHSDGTAMANHIAKRPSPFPSPSPSPKISDKASEQALDKSVESAGKSKLEPQHKELADRMETCLNGQWCNDAGKWMLRICGATRKAERVIAEVENAKKESRIKTTPAQYAEQIWKEFK